MTDEIGDFRGHRMQTLLESGHCCRDVGQLWRRTHRLWRWRRRLFFHVGFKLISHRADSPCNEIIEWILRNHFNVLDKCPTCAVGRDFAWSTQAIPHIAQNRSKPLQKYLREKKSAL